MFNDPTFWVLISFIIFLGATGPLLWRKLLGEIDAYREQVIEKIEEASSSKQVAQDLWEKAKQEYEAACLQCEEIRVHAEQESERLHHSMTDRIEAYIQIKEHQLALSIKQLEHDVEKMVQNHLTDESLRRARDILQSNSLSYTKSILSNLEA